MTFLILNQILGFLVAYFSERHYNVLFEEKKWSDLPPPLTTKVASFMMVDITPCQTKTSSVQKQMV